MSVKTIQPRLNNAGQVLGAGPFPDTQDRYSPGLWDDCPILAIQDGEIPGTVFEYNFDSLPKTPATAEGNFSIFSQFAAAAGTISVPLTGFRGWEFAGAADNDGMGIRCRTVSFQIDRPYKTLWYEVAVKRSTVVDAKLGVFTGLIEDVTFDATHPLTAAGALSDNNVVGFLSGEGVGKGVAFDTVYKANGVPAVTVKAGAAPITADTYIKLGMKFVPDLDPVVQDPNFQSLGKYNLFFYANGVRLPDYKLIPVGQGTDFPNDVRLTPFFSIMNAAAAPGTAAIRRMRVAQTY